ncbi:hypothetical protein PFISCL1PPCAC_25728, partial [Pristionchus fissidentatus]
FRMLPGPLFREGGPFDHLYNRPMRNFCFLKFCVAVVFICNFVLAIQLHHVDAPALEILQLIYLSCIFFAFFSFRQLNHKYCIPAVFLAIPNFLLPITIFLYMLTAENYCYVVEHWPSWSEEAENGTAVALTKIICIDSFPYADGFQDKIYVILMFGVGKVCEFLLLFHVQKSIERERISMEMMSFIAEKDKKVPPIDDTDDEMVVYKRENNVVV